MDEYSLASSATPDGLTQEVYALLAHANLCRIRGSWSDAIDKCMAAMRMDPQSVAAHSLLGDIYENKGCLDDAVQWYRMALDINPDSPADQQKLERLLVQKSRMMDRARPALSSAPSSASAAAPSPQLREGWVRDPSKTLRVAAFSSAALVLAIVVVAMLVSHSQGVGGAAQSQIATPPVMLASSGLVNSDDAQKGLSDVRETADRRLLGGMRADADLSGHGVSVTDVQSDPRSGRATVSILIAAKDSVSVNRDAVASAALFAAHSAMRLTDASSYTDFTVRVLTLTTGDAVPASTASLAAVADISRANQAVLDGDITQLTPAQRAQMLTHTWWGGNVLD